MQYSGHAANPVHREREAAKMWLKKIINDIKFSINYDAQKMAQQNAAKYGDGVPDCCRMNREANDKAQK